jgi:hypothetical protein
MFKEKIPPYFHYFHDDPLGEKMVTDSTQNKVFLVTLQSATSTSSDKEHEHSLLLTYKDDKSAIHKLSIVKLKTSGKWTYSKDDNDKDNQQFDTLEKLIDSLMLQQGFTAL